MKTVTCAQMRDMDARTLREAGIPGETLMERAGAGVARVVRRLTEHAGWAPRCLLVAGKGANGGDALVAARHLKATGYEVAVVSACEASAWTGDARIHLGKMTAAGIAVSERPAVEDWAGPFDDDFERMAPCVVVDGILGTGLEGAARGVSARAIERVNEAGRCRPVVAIDIPSGLDADTGMAAGPAVRADATVTMGYPKRGFLACAALDYVGTVDVVDIGIPAAYAEALPTGAEMISASDMADLISPLPRQAHKGSRGHTLIIAGSRGYAGAAGLAARAALRSGAGLVTVLTARSVAPIVAGLAPEAMVHCGAETEAGMLAKDAGRGWTRDVKDFNAVLIGPGLGVGADTLAWVERVLGRSATPAVLDADALSVCAGRLEMIRQARCPVTVTPHPGEMARLLGSTAQDVQADRVGTALSTARDLRCVTVLKGAGTVVCQPDGHPHVNMTGNPGMACGGSGDALAGLLAGLLAQGIGPFDAARLAVHAHGMAGDIAAWRRSQAGMTAADLVDAIPCAWKVMRGR